MEQELEKIAEQQCELLNISSPAWKKWDKLLSDFLKPVDNQIIRMLHSKRNNIVLDVASVTGEPGLTIASIINDGKVIFVHSAEDLLTVVTKKAMQGRIRNFETHVWDVDELPFSDNTFDAICCHFGFMFFPDMLLMAKEMVRVLKPGGKMAISVWNVPEKNFWFTAIAEAINKNMESASPQIGRPGMFRCARDGLMSKLFRQAGLTNISVKEVAGKLDCITTSMYWSLMTETIVPVVALINKADEVMKEKIKREVHQTMNRRYRNGNVRIDSSALVISGEK